MNLKPGGVMRKKKNGRKKIRNRVPKEMGKELKPVKQRKGITEFGYKIGYVMAEKNLTDSKLARISGVSRQTIYMLKRSEYPKGTTVFKIAKALDVPASYFFEEGFNSLYSV